MSVKISIFKCLNENRAIGNENVGPHFKSIGDLQLCHSMSYVQHSLQLYRVFAIIICLEWLDANSEMQSLYLESQLPLSLSFCSAHLTLLSWKKSCIAILQIESFSTPKDKLSWNCLYTLIRLSLVCFTISCSCYFLINSITTESKHEW